MPSLEPNLAAQAIALKAQHPGKDRPAGAWAAQISACWRASVEAILEVGRLISAAKDSLPHGEFTAMIEAQLPFGARTAQMLMAISSDARLTNPKRVSVLPPSWGTLYELHKLDDATLEGRFEDGSITPDLERREVINGARAVMSARQEPDDSLDYFPTPPWATRALMERVFPQLGRRFDSIGKVWEPACGEGHISEVLRSYGIAVYATDVFDYGTATQDRLCDFLSGDYAPSVKPGRFDWIVTNPPFGDRSIGFVTRALEYAGKGVAMFFRSQWAVEGIERYETIFRDHPPTLCAFFVERVPLCKGEWNPHGTTATAYCWLVWVEGEQPRPPFWIPPGCRESLTHPDDIARFAPQYLAAKDSELECDPETGEVVAPVKEAAE